MPEEFDVLVVGAGPSGSTAARHAALGGARTLMIEKRTEIGTPVRCGEGVAKRWLDEVGLEPSKAFIAHEVDGAKVVIGADGIESQVGRWAGLERPLKTRDIDACLQYTIVGVDGDPSLNEFYLGSCAPGGYAWVFWKDADTANIGLGVNLSKLKDKAETKAYLDRFIAAHPHLAHGEILEEVAGMVTVSLPLDRTGMPGLLLVGDAARFIDPVTGGGILNGCLSGKYAGELAASAVKAGDVGASLVAAYENLWKARLEETLYRNYMIKEKLRTMEDEVINKIIRAIVEVGLERVSTHEILAALRKKHPELVAEFEGFL